MDTSTHILVIILSVTLALFLVLAITATVITIRVLRSIDRLVKKAEGIVNTAEHVGNVFKNVSGPIAIARLLQNIFEVVTKHNKRSK